LDFSRHSILLKILCKMLFWRGTCVRIEFDVEERDNEEEGVAEEELDDEDR
jgi:hypothetical protein